MSNQQPNDGGPAFPVPYSNESDGPTVMPTVGMSLRDYFAVKVLPNIYSTAMVEAAEGSGLFSDPGWRMGLALDAYAMADAMLKARGQ
ncbi:MAG TPA: hypothetical protein VFM33_02750 [Aquabacterium sp.]|nr:hypothetical protein [Aquabacterium sp.]